MKFHFTLLLVFISLCGQAQTAKKYDITDMEATIRINPWEQKVQGDVVYRLIIKENTREIIFDAPGIQTEQVKTGCFNTAFTQTDKILKINKKFKKGKKYKIRINYTAFPKKAMYFTGWNGKGEQQIWTQGQGKNNSHWIPTNDDQNDKFTWTFHIAFPQGYRVISNGIFTGKTSSNTTTDTYTYRQTQPAPAYLIFIGGGKYDESIVHTSSGIPVYNYQYQNKTEHDKTYYKTREIFDFIENEIGVKYPWKNYKQIPCRDFLYGGMENVSATSFNGDRYVVDSLAFADVNFVNVSAHELTHQWFGDWVTGKSSADHWLHEAFATYYARLNDKHIFGKAYNDYNIYNYDRQIIASQKTDTVPLYHPNASSLTYYQKGAKIIAMMRKKTGDENYRKVIKKYLQTYAYKNASTADFKRVLYEVTGDSLPEFFKLWFETSQIPEFDIRQQNDSLIFVKNSHHLPVDFLITTREKSYKISRKNHFKLDDFENIQSIIVNPGNELLADIHFQRDNKFIRHQILHATEFIDKYIALKEIENWGFPEKKVIFEQLIAQDNFYPVYAKIIRQTKKSGLNKEKTELITPLFQKDLKTRQQIAIQVDSIPASIKNEYKTLLHDASYITRQSALWHYWANFKNEQVSILEETQNMPDNYDKTFRISWLSMALLTPEFQPRQKMSFVREIIAYSSPDYHMLIRLNAFEMLLNLDLINAEVIDNLLEAGLHFNWRMHKPAREMLKELYQNINYKYLINSRVSLLSAEMHAFYQGLFAGN